MEKNYEIKWIETMSGAFINVDYIAYFCIRHYADTYVVKAIMNGNEDNEIYVAQFEMRDDAVVFIDELVCKICKEGGHNVLYSDLIVEDIVEETEEDNGDDK